MVRQERIESLNGNSYNLIMVNIYNIYTESPILYFDSL